MGEKGSDFFIVTHSWKIQAEKGVYFQLLHTHEKLKIMDYLTLFYVQNTLNTLVFLTSFIVQYTCMSS